MKLIKEQGLGSLYRGTPATLIRDTPSMGLYFASYEGIKGWMKTQWGFSKEASSCWAGGLAGALSWGVIYPFDVVKSIQQVLCTPLTNGGEKGGIVACPVRCHVSFLTTPFASPSSFRKGSPLDKLSKAGWCSAEE